MAYIPLPKRVEDIENNEGARILLNKKFYPLYPSYESLPTTKIVNYRGVFRRLNTPDIIRNLLDKREFTSEKDLRKSGIDPKMIENTIDAEAIRLLVELATRKPAIVYGSYQKDEVYPSSIGMTATAIKGKIQRSLNAILGVGMVSGAFFGRDVGTKITSDLLARLVHSLSKSPMGMYAFGAVTPTLFELFEMWRRARLRRSVGKKRLSREEREFLQKEISRYVADLLRDHVESVTEVLFKHQTNMAKILGARSESYSETYRHVVEEMVDSVLKPLVRSHILASVQQQKIKKRKARTLMNDLEKFLNEVKEHLLSTNPQRRSPSHPTR